MREFRNSNEILVRKPKGRIPPMRLRSRLEYDINMSL
jgi:hypothetical protein